MNTSDFIQLLEARAKELEAEILEIDLKTVTNLNKLNDLYSRFEEVHHIWDMINKI